MPVFEEPNGASGYRRKTKKLETTCICVAQLEGGGKCNQRFAVTSPCPNADQHAAVAKPHRQQVADGDHLPKIVRVARPYFSTAGDFPRGNAAFA